MRDFTKRAMDEAMWQQEEQAGPKKPSIARSSPFQPWQPKKGLGFVEGCSSNPGHARKKSIDVGGSTSGAGAGAGADPEENSKRLKRILANRAAAERSRTKKNDYTVALEQKAKAYQNQVSRLQPQIEVHKNHQRMLQIEHHQLKLRMAICEKNRVLEEVEIERKRAEVKRLSELQRKLTAEARAKFQNNSTVMQHRPNSNLNASGFGQWLNLNPNQGCTEVGTSSRLQSEIGKHTENQTQHWIDKLIKY